MMSKINTTLLISLFIIALSLCMSTALLSSNGQNFLLTDNIKSSILLKFVKVHTDLHALDGISKTLYAAPIENSSKCTISMDKLKDLNEEIKNALEDSHVPSTDVNCDLDEYNPNGSCNELIKLMQCGIENLKNSIGNATSDEELIKIKKQYEIALEKYRKFAENNVQKITQDFKVQIDILLNDLQELRSEFNKIQDKLEKEEIEKMTFRIMNGRSPQAAEDFKSILNLKVDHVYVIKSVIENCYAFENVRRLLEFFKYLPTNDITAEGYEFLYAIMSEKNHLSEKYVHTLYDIVNSVLTQSNDFKGNLTNLYMNMMQKYAKIIHESKNCNFVSEILPTNVSTDHHLENITREAYKVQSDVGIILDCYESLASNEDKVTMLKFVYEQMRQRDELDTHQILLITAKAEDFDLFSLSKYKRGKIQELKAHLPSSVRDLIINNGRCVIRNRVFNYLFTSFAFDNKKQDVLTAKLDLSNAYTLWKIKMMNDGEYFTLMHKFSSKYLYGDECDGGKCIFAWKRGGNADAIDTRTHWKFEPNKGANTFKLKNVSTNEYLTKEERKVHSSGVAINGDSDWEISC